MNVLSCKVEIGDKEFYRINNVLIKKEVANILQTATLKIPTTARLTRAGDFVTEIETAKSFQVGDEVIINLGYNDNLNEEFRGYVSKIKPQLPLVIEAENETFILKRKSLNKGFKNTNLRDVIEYILQGTGIRLVENIPSISFDVFYLKNVNAAQALQKISKEYGLRIYFKSWKKLFVGLVNENDGKLVRYDTSQNVINNKLEWQNKEDVKLKVKAISVRPDNSRIEIEIGDDDGDKRTLWFYNLSSKMDLKIKAKAEIEKYKYSGYKGYLNAFLQPLIEVGNTVEYLDADFPERKGNYLVNAVETKFGDSGARRKIELGIKINI